MVISIMASQLTGISTSIFIIILNIPFLIIGYKSLGKEFVLKALFCNACVFRSTLLYRDITYWNR